MDFSESFLKKLEENLVYVEDLSIKAEYRIKFKIKVQVPTKTVKVYGKEYTRKFQDSDWIHLGVSLEKILPEFVSDKTGLIRRTDKKDSTFPAIIEEKLDLILKMLEEKKKEYFKSLPTESELKKSTKRIITKQWADKMTAIKNIREKNVKRNTYGNFNTTSLLPYLFPKLTVYEHKIPQNSEELQHSLVDNKLYITADNYEVNGRETMLQKTGSYIQEYAIHKGYPFVLLVSYIYRRYASSKREWNSYKSMTRSVSILGMDETGLFLINVPPMCVDEDKRIRNITNNAPNAKSSIKKPFRELTEDQLLSIRNSGLAFAEFWATRVPADIIPIENICK